MRQVIKEVKTYKPYFPVCHWFKKKLGANLIIHRKNNGWVIIQTVKLTINNNQVIERVEQW